MPFVNVCQFLRTLEVISFFVLRVGYGTDLY